jgi:hypothetical protein
VPAPFGDQVAQTCLQALGADPDRIAAALAHALPSVDGGGAARPGEGDGARVAPGDDAPGRRTRRGPTSRTR